MAAIKFTDATKAYPRTIAPAGKYPIVGDRIYATLKDAQDYVDGNSSSKSAIPGITLSVISDGENNGAYWVSQAAGYDGATVGVLQKLEIGGGTSGSDVSFSIASNTTNAVSLTVNNETKNITVATMKSSLGLKALAYEESVVEALGYTPLDQDDFTKAKLGLGNVTNLAASKYLTALSANTDNAVSITVGGTTKTIGVADMKTALGLAGLAYKASVPDALGYTPFDKANFTKENIKSKLGISDWALEATKPSYGKSDVGLGNVDNIAAKDYFTALTSGTTNAVSMTIGGVTKDITASTLKSSLGLKSLAYKDSLAFSDLDEHPTTLSGYGITDALGSGGTAVAAEKLSDSSAFTIWGNTFFTGGKPKSVTGDLTLASGRVLKIGDATISWDSANQMLKIDKGIYSEGAITAKKKA